MTSVNLKVKNPARPLKVFAGKFLVDSGATFTVVPEEKLHDLGIKPKREVDLELADGTWIKRKAGNALYEFEGTEAAGPVLFGEKGDTLLLGALTLEALGLILDPLKRQLRQATLRL
ncbi:aspartyl protease [Candidatus Gottesmanbacteria bacterium]|nr:aspartyl protease [Candidatus Gottesmanbacteria bacterium]